MYCMYGILCAIALSSCISNMQRKFKTDRVSSAADYITDVVGGEQEGCLSNPQG